MTPIEKLLNWKTYLLSVKTNADGSITAHDITFKKIRSHELDFDIMVGNTLKFDDCYIGNEFLSRIKFDETNKIFQRFVADKNCEFSTSYKTGITVQSANISRCAVDNLQIFKHPLKDFSLEFVNCGLKSFSGLGSCELNLYVNYCDIFPGFKEFPDFTKSIHLTATSESEIPANPLAIFTMEKLIYFTTESKENCPSYVLNTIEKNFTDGDIYACALELIEEGFERFAIL